MIIRRVLELGVNRATELFSEQQKHQPAVSDLHSDHLLLILFVQFQSQRLHFMNFVFLFI